MNLRIKPKKRLIREKPEPLSVPTAINEVWSMDFMHDQLSNLPRSIDTFVQPNLSMTVNGTPFALKGRSKPFADSLDTILAIDIEQLDLASYLPFSPVALPLAIQSANLSTRLDLHFDRQGTQPQIGIDGSIRLSNLVAQDKNAAPLIKIAAIDAQIKQFDLIHLNGVIDEIKLDNPQFWADLNQHGELNWTRLSSSPGSLVGNSGAASCWVRYNSALHGADLVSTWVAKQSRAYRGLTTS